MGGGLTLVLACQRPDKVKAACPFYGVIPWAEAQPDWSKLEAAVEGHYAQNDEFASPEAVAELENKLKNLGKDVVMYVYPDTDHAFFNDARPEVYNAAASHLAFSRTDRASSGSSALSKPKAPGPIAAPARYREQA